ncbi:MAG: fumarate hydratase [Candidatus Omnitrophica bacterium]|nr:fumarate hydratase [Candidatus Omnitrophota bacterium]
MRTVNSGLIAKVVKALCIKANLELRPDVLYALRRARKKETGDKARRILDIIIYNAAIAKRKHLPICQDTGMVVVYLEVGQDVRIKGDIDNAVADGMRDAYKDGYFRKSIVRDPLIRTNTNTNLPPVIYTKIVPGNKVKVILVVKGFGCENASMTRMFRPTDPASSIVNFAAGVIKELGSKACPPMYIGIGMGGTLDKAVSLSKEAILRPVGEYSKKPHIAKLEKEILQRVNKLKIGPMGVGGKTTALGVSILTYPTHIAGLPVAVNISCHATRDARKVI